MSDDQAKKKTAAKPPQHPKYKEMITAAIESLKERNGSSRQAISKYIKENYTVGDSCDVHIKVELKRLAANNVLVHTKGTGASGSFKVNKKAPEKPGKKTPQKKKPAAKKTKKPVAKKAAKKVTPKKTARKVVKKNPVADKKPVAKTAAKKKKVTKKGKK